MRGADRTRRMVEALLQRGAGTAVVHSDVMAAYVGQMLWDLGGPAAHAAVPVRAVRDFYEAQCLAGMPQPICLDHALEETAPCDLVAMLRTIPGVLGEAQYAPPARSYWFGPGLGEARTEIAPAFTAAELADVNQRLAEDWRRLVDATINPPTVAVDAGRPDAHTVIWTYRGVPVRETDHVVVGPDMNAFEVEARWREIRSGPRPGAVHYVEYIRDRNVLFAYEGFDTRASECGKKLLREWLSPAQLASYDAHAHFEVVGQASGKRYRIRDGTAINIDELAADGSVACRWCFGPQGGLVAGDVMLAQKIALETDETAVLKVANRHAAPGAGAWRQAVYGGDTRAACELFVRENELLRGITS